MLNVQNPKYLSVFKINFDSQSNNHQATIKQIQKQKWFATTWLDSNLLRRWGYTPPCKLIESSNHQANGSSPYGDVTHSLGFYIRVIRFDAVILDCLFDDSANHRTIFFIDTKPLSQGGVVHRALIKILKDAMEVSSTLNRHRFNRHLRVI